MERLAAFSHDRSVRYWLWLIAAYVCLLVVIATVARYVHTHPSDLGWRD
jgi:hypothetical protein